MRQERAELREVLSVCSQIVLMHSSCRKQGDQMSHQRTYAFVEMKGEVTLLVSRAAGSPPSTTKHTGFDIYVEQFGM